MRSVVNSKRIFVDEGISDNKNILINFDLRVFGYDFYLFIGTNLDVTSELSQVQNGIGRAD